MNHKDAILPFGEDIRTGSRGSILSALYRNILKDIDVEEIRFKAMVDRYITRSCAGTITDTKELSSLIGNLLKELMKSEMTWKVFVKGLKVLNVVKFDIGLKLTFEGNDDVTLKRTIDLHSLSPDKDERTETILSDLFKQVMFTMNITSARFDTYVRDYITKMDIPVNIKEISSARGNLRKELLKGTMTWNVFIKGLVFLNVSQFEVGVSLTYLNGKITSHYRGVTLEYNHGT